jgi:hypothetical protein
MIGSLTSMATTVRHPRYGEASTTDTQENL